MESEDGPRLLEIVREHSMTARVVSENLMSYSGTIDLRREIREIVSLRRERAAIIKRHVIKEEDPDHATS